MSFLPPKPPSEATISRKEVYKRFNCAMFHQKHWQTYTACVEPHIRIAVCCTCGANHLIKKGFTTAVETDIKIDKIIHEAIG